MGKPKRTRIEEEAIRSGRGHRGKKNQLSPEEQKRQLKNATRKLRG